jgi:hypothetical protein
VRSGTSLLSLRAGARAPVSNRTAELNQLRTRLPECAPLNGHSVRSKGLSRWRKHMSASTSTGTTGAGNLGPLFDSLNKATNGNGVAEATSELTQLTLTSMQRCLQTVTFSQDVTLVCNVPSDVAIAFVQSPACQKCQLGGSANAADCSDVCAACVQSGIKQSATLVVTTACQADSTQAAQIKADYNAAIDQAVSNKSGTIASLMNLAPTGNDNAPGTDNYNTVSIGNSLKNLVSSTDIVSLLNSVDQSQTVTIVSNNGGSVQGAITQNLLFQSTSALIAKNLQDAGVTTAVSLTAAQTASSTVGGSADSSSLAIYLGVGLGLIALIIGAVLLIRSISKRRQDAADKIAATHVPPASAHVVASPATMSPTASPGESPAASPH